MHGHVGIDGVPQHRLLPARPSIPASGQVWLEAVPPTPKCPPPQTPTHRVHAIFKFMPVPNVSTPLVKKSMLSSSMGMLGLMGSRNTVCCPSAPPSLLLGESGWWLLTVLPPSLKVSLGGLIRKWKIRTSMRFITSSSTYKLIRTDTGTVGVH